MEKFSDRGTEATDNTDAKDVRASADGASADFPLCLVDYINPLTPSWRWKQGAYWLFALFVYHYLWDVAAAHALAPGWVAAVVARNLAVMTIWYGGYHHVSSTPSWSRTRRSTSLTRSSHSQSSTSETRSGPPSVS